MLKTSNSTPKIIGEYYCKKASLSIMVFTLQLINQSTNYQSTKPLPSPTGASTAAAAAAKATETTASTSAAPAAATTPTAAAATVKHAA